MNSHDESQAHVLVTGFVQGVGFRQFVKRQARGLGLTGWTRNLPDGSVEIIACGLKENIEKLIEQCKKGPFLSEVHNVTVSWDETGEKFEEFSLLSTPPEMS